MIPAVSGAQPFVDVEADLVGVGSHSFASWGDYDGDGDLDLLLGGRTGSSSAVSRIYRNDGAHFEPLDSFGWIEDATGNWVDYDNDGDLDIFIAGQGGNTQPRAWLLRNDGNDAFVHVDTEVEPVDDAAAAWGDYDSDGDQDLLLTGEKSSGSITRLYENKGGGQFTPFSTALPDVARGAVAWGDYDGDGDLDVLLQGFFSNNAPHADVYRNDGDGTFTALQAGLPGTFTGAVQWGDYDSDGDLDILLTGFVSYNYGDEVYEAEIYRNDDGMFMPIGAGLRPMSESAAAFGDYDNDGDLDVLIAGRPLCNSYCPDAAVFRNDGNTFTNLGLDLPGTIRGAVAWGDYDNDGRLDFLLAGEGPQLSNNQSVLYRNAGRGAPNTPPTAPEPLETVVRGDEVELRWRGARDRETGGDGGLSYNLLVGSQTGTGDVVAALADPATGFRRVAARGSIEGNTHIVRDLCNGTYYWAVQAVDAAYAGSAFSEGSSFTIRDSPNQPPRIDFLPERVTLAYPIYEYPVAVSDDDGDAIFFEIHGASNGVTIDTVSGFITAQPTVIDPAVQHVTITVRDRCGERTQAAEVALDYPVDFSTLAAMRADSLVELSWTTTFEMHVQRFGVERRTGQGTWKEAGYTAGSGISTAPRIYTFLDQSAEADSLEQYEYRLAVWGPGGGPLYTKPFSLADPVSTAPAPVAPAEVHLQGYPSPFRDRATLAVDLPEASSVHLAIYDLVGRQVHTLVAEPLAAGRHTFDWDADRLPSGVYFCRLRTGGVLRTVKLLLLK